MFYIMYLTSLCTRRSWPAPQFTVYRTRAGHHCIVRVNNREYSTGETAYESEELARNAAATQAYMICRNFSVNDGMLPGQRPGMVGVGDASGCQGLPAAIGSGRRRRTGGGSGGSGSSGHSIDTDQSSSSGSSGGDSPTDRMSRTYMNAAAARRPSAVCRCRRAYVTSSGYCAYCLREAGYA